jgi:hypothetical protein
VPLEPERMIRASLLTEVVGDHDIRQVRVEAGGDAREPASCACR